MALTQEEVKGLAHLARIGLSEGEAERAQKELGDILGFVDRLQRVPTEGVLEASSSVIPADSFREDIAVSSDDVTRDSILQNFPASQSGMLKAPAVFSAPKK